MERIKDFLVGLLFLLFDVLMIIITFQIAIIVRVYLTPWFGTQVDFPSVERMILICILLFITIFLTVGLYPGYGLTTVKELQQTSRAIMVVYFLLMGISYLIKSNYNFSRFILLAAFVMDIFLLPLAHFALRNFLSRFAFYGTSVHIFGEPENTTSVEKTLKNVRRLGWRVNAVYPLAYANKTNAIQPSSSIAILATNSLKKARRYERNLSHTYRKVVVVPKNVNLVSHWVVQRDLGEEFGLEFRYNLLARYSIVIKQISDYVLSFLAIILLCPWLILAAISIKLDSPGPVIYKQTRMGKNAKPFELYKFRTMYTNADELLEKLLSSNQVIRAEYDQYHKIRKDPRITRVGKWLRRYSFDEFPQLLNVLAGDMSLSGPRPYLPSEKSEMGDFVKIILRVKPGISGWWQVLGGNNVSFLRRLEMDEYYISNWSVWMDIYIFLKTFGVILVGKGL